MPLWRRFWMTMRLQRFLTPHKKSSTEMLRLKRCQRIGDVVVPDAGAPPWRSLESRLVGLGQLNPAPVVHLEPLPLITEEQFFAPCFEQDWKLHLRLTIGLFLVLHRNFQARLWASDEVGPRSATKRTLQFVEGFAGLIRLSFGVYMHELKNSIDTFGRYSSHR